MLPLRMLGFLMLMLSLCVSIAPRVTSDGDKRKKQDADNLCPTDLNPLSLDPSEVIYGYEESVLVNCTSTEDNHAGMYWTVGNTDLPTEYDNPYIQVVLSNWDVKAECKIRLHDTHECSKDLKITVYKNPEMVRIFSARYVPIVEGTPFELQCDIINVAPVQNLTVRWYKNNQAIREDSFPNPTKTPVNESSTLLVNISREENRAKFRCEAQLDFGPHGSQPVTSDTFTVAVHYAPELKNKMEDVYVNEENNVTLNCDAEGHPPPHFHWTCDGLNISENTNNLSITQVITSTTCACTATNYLGRINKQIHVHVTPKGCPLVVTPAEMVVRFGDPASVNCSTNADVQQMGWEAPVGATSNPGPAVIWKVEKLEDWQITPLCFIDLKENYQCYKELTITLYKTPDIVSVSALDDGPMVEGTEYHLKCDIINVAPVQKLKVTWYRGNETVHTDVFNETSKVPVNVSSTLRVTPVGDYNGAHFICKAELQLGPNGPETDTTVTSSPYMAVVHYKPVLKACPARYSGVEHDFSMDKLPCLADGNPPPIVEWYFDGDLINASEPLTRTQSGNYTAEIYNNLDRSTTSIVITIEYAPELKNKMEDVYVNEKNNVTLNCDAEGHPPPHFHWTCDGLNISENTNNLSITQVITSTTCACTATNYLGRINKQIHVHVTPKGCPLVVTPAEMVVRFGDPASVNCSTNADVQQMGWEAPVGATSNPGPAVIWKVEKLEDWQITPLCFINLKENYQCYKELTITLYKTPDIVSVSALDDGPMVEGTEYHLKCNIINVAPVQKLKVTWYRGNETVHTDVFNETSKVPVNVSSTLRVTPVGDYNGAHFICKAELQLGPNGPETDTTVTSSPYMAVVHYKPVLKACPARYSSVEHDFSMDKLPCLADGNPPPIVEWYFDGDLINASEPLTRSQSGNYTAEIYNNLDRSTTSIVITIEYAPVFKEGTYKKEVNLGENVTIDCSAEGNPVPEILWTFSPAVIGKNTTKRRQKNIHIIGATSTHAGVYSCDATNEVGRVTKSVTLTMKDKTSEVSSTAKWWLIIFIAILIVIILIVILTRVHNQCKKHGQYSFVPDKANDVSDIPMTQSNGVHA